MENSCNEKFQFATGFMREQRKVWSLQNDVDLLNNLETFSQGLLKKTCFIMDSMEEFHREINMTSISVKTLSNNLEGVSDSQFVENRVYDEEDDMICEEDKNKNDSISLNLSNRLEESLKLCSKTLDSKFEAVSITMSDSEDDVDIFNKSEVILIPKNKYKSRPLPHMIGGKDFYLDDSLGLLPSSNESEDGEENLFSGEDDIHHHSELTGTDKVDSYIQKDSLCNNTTNEIERIDAPDNCLIENEDKWKEISYQDDQCVKDTYSEKKIEPQSAVENFSPSSFQNIATGVQISAAITDEIKGILREENYNEGQAKLPIFRKTQNSIHRKKFKDVEDTHQINNDSNNTQESDYPKHIPNIFKSSEQSVFSKAIHSKTTLSTKTNDYIEERMSEENVLPNIPTEVLHSFAKSRAKIKGKRRLPSRRIRNISHNNEADIVKPEPRDNTILSPSTDEEDLFVLPHVHAIKESSTDSLFGTPSLFSPGSSIEGEAKSLFCSSKLKKEDTIADRKEGLMDEPLGIKKSSFDSDVRNSNFFSDWDNFNTEESGLFSSVERKARKTKLFDDFHGSSEKTSKDNDLDDDIFLFHSSPSSDSAPSLFSSSLSSAVDFTAKNLDSSKTSKLFFDNDNSYSKTLFSNPNIDDLPYKSSDSNHKKLNFISKPDVGSEKNGNKHMNDEKLKNVSCSNPLMDTEDNLFD